MEALVNAPDLVHHQLVAISRNKVGVESLVEASQDLPGKLLELFGIRPLVAQPRFNVLGKPVSSEPPHRLHLDGVAKLVEILDIGEQELAHSVALMRITLQQSFGGEFG